MTLEEIRSTLQQVLQTCSPLTRVSYKLKEAAAVMGLSESFLRAEIRAKRLVAVKLSRHVLIESSAIQDYLSKRRTTEAPQEGVWESLSAARSTTTDSGSMVS